MEEELRRRLAFHFMDPVDKFIARRQVPWKLLLQFLKGTLIEIINHEFSSLILHENVLLANHIFTQQF